MYYLIKNNNDYIVSETESDSALGVFDNWIDAQVAKKELETGYSFERYKYRMNNLNEFLQDPPSRW